MSATVRGATAIIRPALQPHFPLNTRFSSSTSSPPNTSTPSYTGRFSSGKFTSKSSATAKPRSEKSRSFENSEKSSRSVERSTNAPSSIDPAAPRNDNDETTRHSSSSSISGTASPRRNTSILANLGSLAQAAEQAVEPKRLGAVVTVNSNNIGAAIAQLNKITRADRIQELEEYNRYREKPTLKRQRLKRERAEKAFALDISNKVEAVRNMLKRYEGGRRTADRMLFF